MDWINKKFKTKVSYFARGKYTVSYAHYRFIPIWHELRFWFHQGVTGGTECWSTQLLKVDEAERLAKGLKSINDVKEYYKEDEIRMEDFYKRKSEYYKKAVPYSHKVF
ncbi:hypothetical protein KAR91_70540 [Candidatus Pacearchaeota archaeon]|nr:hypothetical protein [Candidatus Pacearchaeota archaeon]